MLVQICRQHFHHLAPWQRITERISEPPQWTPQQDTVHNAGRRRRRPPSIPAQWHLQKNGQLLRSTESIGTHLYQSVPTSQKQSILASLIHRTKALCDQDSLTQELELLITVFNDTGYSPQQIRWLLKTASQTAKTHDKLTFTAFITYTQTTCGWLSRMLAKHIIKSVSDYFAALVRCKKDVAAKEITLKENKIFFFLFPVYLFWELCLVA